MGAEALLPALVGQNEKLQIPPLRYPTVGMTKERWCFDLDFIAGRKAKFV
jgi:hypothetical protein